MSNVWIMNKDFQLAIDNNGAITEFFYNFILTLAEQIFFPIPTVKWLLIVIHNIVLLTAFCGLKAIVLVTAFAP